MERATGIGAVFVRARDPEALDAGADVSERVEEYDYGRFGWAHDLGGNRFELWQPT